MPFRLRFLALALPLSGIAACDGGKEEGGRGQTLTGDMTGAVSLALSKPAQQPLSFVPGGGGTIDTSGEPFFSLVKIDSNGNLDAVFNQQRPIHWVEVNDTHVAVSGDFYDIAALVDDDESPRSVYCGLVVFPRTASDEPVKCLATFGTGFNNDPLEGSSDYPGFTARGTAVYFTELFQPSPDEGYTKVWKWESGADVVEELLDLLPPVKLAQTFALRDDGHLCALSPPSGETLYCTPLGTIAWEVVPNEPGGHANRRALVLGTNLLGGFSKVSLVDGTSVTEGEPNLPSGRNHTILVGDTAWGLSIGIGNPGGGIVRVTPAGGELLDDSVAWERIAGEEGGAFVFGGGQLRRLDFATKTLGADFLSETTLLQVTDMSLSTNGNVRLDGTTGGGQPAIVLVNTSSGEVTITNEDVPTFQSVTPLE